MKLAVLTDRSSLDLLLKAFRSAADIELMGVWSSTDETASETFFRTPHDASWDELLNSLPDVIVVAGTSSELVSAVRQFVQRKCPVLIDIASSVEPSELFRYLPLWQEGPGRVSPFFRSGVSPLLPMALERMQESGCGPLWRIDFQRDIPVPASRGLEMPMSAVDRVFLQDLKWICELTGLPRHVTFQTSGRADAPSEVTAVLSSDTGVEARWRLRRHAGPESWELKLQGTQGELTVHCEAHQKVTIRVGESIVTIAVEDTRIADALEQLSLLTEQDKIGSRGQRGTGEVESPLPSSSPHEGNGGRLLPHLPGSKSAPGWEDLIRLGEVGAAARRSLQRRRTIDLHYGEASERNQFKTQMTALGCGVLLWTMFGMIGLMAVASFFDPRDREYRKSSAAGFILEQKDFEPESARLTRDGLGRVQSIAASWSSTSPVLLIEQSTDALKQGDEDRAKSVQGALKDRGISDFASRTVIRPFPGKWFEILMRVSWVLLFLPLAIVLGLQLLILITRSPEPSRSEP